MFRLAKEPSSGQLQSLKYVMACVHIMGFHIAYKILKYSQNNWKMARKFLDDNL
jgi:hypothetical protein